MLHRVRRVRSLCVALVVAGMAVSACGGDDDSADSTSAAAADTSSSGSGDGPASPTTGSAAPGSSPAPAGAEPAAVEDCTATVAGTTLNYAGLAPTASLDPLQSSAGLVGGSELIAIYDVLMRWDHVSGEWVPHAAQSLEHNDDFTVWTLKMRPEVKYSDGTPMLAQHVIDNMRRLLEPGRNGSRGLISWVDLDNSKAIDDTTAEFKMVRPWSNFAYLLADEPGMVVNPALGAQKDDKGVSIVANNPTGAGAGAYTVERWAPGESPYLVLKARPDYWGGAPCIETLNFLSLPTERQRADALETGELDVSLHREDSVINEIRASGKFQEYFDLQSTAQALFINNGIGTHNPITEDVRFRKAVYAALDTQQLSQRAFGGALIQQDGFLHPDSLYYSAGTPAPERGADVAKRLVEELKSSGWDGKIRLVCANSNPDLSVVIEALLESAGMSVDTQVADVNATIAKMFVERDYDLGCNSIPIADSYVWRTIASNLYSTSPSNRMGIKIPAIDAAIDEFFAAPDLETRRVAMKALGTAYAEQVPFAAFGALNQGIFYDKKIRDLLISQQSMYIFADAKIDS